MGLCDDCVLNPCDLRNKTDHCSIKRTRLYPYPDDPQAALALGMSPVKFRVEDDAVNHPPHYNRHPSGVECITITEYFNFNVGNAIKYLWRAGLKGGTLEDLRKAEWYVKREIQRTEKKED